VQTIEKLVSKPDTRAAAITMLGKTLDLCPEKVRGWGWSEGWGGGEGEGQS